MTIRSQARIGPGSIHGWPSSGTRRRSARQAGRMTWDRMLAGDETGEPIAGAYRLVRRLGAAEAPIPGELAAVGEETVVLVDVAALRGWRGWDIEGGQHLCGVLDVARRPDGHDGVLPHCLRALDGRAFAGGLTGGEAVTLAVSLLRGCAEAESLPGDPPTGAWWLLADGRPAFVPALGGGGDASAPAAARILDDATQGIEDRVLRRLLDDVAEVLADGDPVAPRLDALEDRLFEACAPRPLRPVPTADEAMQTDLPAEAGVRRRAESPAGRRSRERRRERGVGTAGAFRPLWDRDPREHIDALLSGRLVEGASTWLHETGERLRRLRDRRGAPAIVAVVTAGIVVVAGLAWPSGEESATAGVSGHPTPGASTDPREPDAADAPAAESPRDQHAAGDEEDARPDGVGDEGVGAPDAEQTRGAEDPVAAAQRLLDGLGVCRAAGDMRCGAVVAAGASLDLSDGQAATWLPAQQRTVALLDDFGDVAVLRVGAADPAAEAGAVSLVVERDGERWLVRALHPLGHAKGAG